MKKWIETTGNLWKSGAFIQQIFFPDRSTEKIKKDCAGSILNKILSNRGGSGNRFANTAEHNGISIDTLFLKRRSVRHRFSRQKLFWSMDNRIIRFYPLCRSNLCSSFRANASKLKILLILSMIYLDFV